MSVKVEHKILGVVTDFCYDQNGTRMALAVGSSVQIYQHDGKAWKLEDTLTKHYMHVSGVDWDHVNDRIVSVSHDRNAFVWEYDSVEALWKPTLVVCRCLKSLLCVSWSPGGNKIAIGAADKSITVCYYDGSNDCWVAKKCKKPITSSVTCLDWNDNNMHVVAGTMSNQVLLYMAFVKECEPRPKPDREGGDMLKYKRPFSGIWESKTIGSVQAVKFVVRNKECTDACFVASDNASCLYFFDTTASEKAIWIFPTAYLPFKTIEVMNDHVLCAAGYSYEPILYDFKREGCQELKQLDEKKKSAKKTKVNAAFKMFQNIADMGEMQGDKKSKKEKNTKHTNTIAMIRIAGIREPGQRGIGKAVKISTGGIDGRVVTWSLSTCL